MSELLYDTNFWVLISFVIFIGVFIKYGLKTALGGLDNKINAIKTELAQAETLRVEAQELLAEYQRKHDDAIKEAELIIADAKKHAESIRLKAEDDMERTKTRREQQLADKLARIEENAKSEIQAYTARIAVNAARDILSQNMDSKSDKVIIENTLAQASKALH
jgi:F-type H+-transporting ATPase subunit b